MSRITGKQTPVRFEKTVYQWVSQYRQGLERVRPVLADVLVQVRRYVSEISLL